MRTITVTLPVAALCAVRESAAVKDTRCYLVGVLLEQGPYGTVLAATDGLTLGAYHVSSDPAAPARVIIPLHMLKAAKPRVFDAAELTAEEREPAEEGGPPRWRLTLDFENGVTVRGDAVDGWYPEWRCIVPAAVSGEVGQFNPSLLVRFQRAAAMLKAEPFRGTEPLSLGFNGESAVVRLPDEDKFVGMVGAWHVDKAHGAPEWVHTATEADQ